MNNDFISRSELKNHKFVGNKFVQIGGRTNGKTLENINRAYQQGWNDAIDAIIENAPAVPEKSQGDLISREALKEAINTYDTFACLPDGKLYPVRELEHPEMFVTYIHVEDVIKAIDNAPTVSDRYDEGYAQGYIDGSTGADWKGGAV